MKAITSANWANQVERPIKLLHPSMPKVVDLIPYLNRVEDSGIYTNNGPLCRELEHRIEADIPGVYAVALANATLALELSIRAITEHSEVSGCFLPAWTFPATVHAVIRAGLQPIFIDVSATTWALEPFAIASLHSDLLNGCALVLAVSPFGSPLNMTAWAKFRQSSRIPVLVDLAACADVQLLRDVPAVVSLHATKPVGAGEGGVLLTSSLALAKRVRSSANFGFDGSWEAQFAGTNAKMSEFHAAVALASLDQWPRKREGLMRVARRYLSLMKDDMRIEFQEGWGEAWISTTLNVRTNAPVENVAAALARRQIEARSWWAGVAPDHRAFAHLRCVNDVKSARALAGTVIGLPFHELLSEREVEYVCGALLVDIPRVPSAE